jgi:rifampicin phosphotransferase
VVASNNGPSGHGSPRAPSHATAMAEHLILDLTQIDRSQCSLVGGKGAQLGALARLEGIHVPGGFCVSTDAFRRATLQLPRLRHQLDRLSALDANDRDTIRVLSAEIRSALERVVIPEQLASAVVRSLAQFGSNAAFAVRSSATAEDSPSFSFAGQHDTYLNVMGSAAILEHVRRCWASLFSERAVTYRLQRSIDHRGVGMAVIVQQMVLSRVSGMLFTADPLTSNRKVMSIQASFGLGEALASGLANPDVYTVRDDRLVTKVVASKDRAIQAAPRGGTQEMTIDPARRLEMALSESQIAELAALGRRIERHFGTPQDIEWCLAADGFSIVQSRPITTLFPIPQASDREYHVYISVGHQQMMTDAIRPLGLSMWQRTTTRPMYEAGGRLFVDVTKELASRARRADFLDLWARADPLTGDALRTLLERADFAPTTADEAPGTTPTGGAQVRIDADPAIVLELMQDCQASLSRLKREIRTHSGEALFDFILKDLDELKLILFGPRSRGVIRAAMDASSWLNEHVEAWLDEKNASDRLTKSVPNNVTSEMGLALLDVADVIRPCPDVVTFLRHAEGDGFLEALPTVPGGREARAAISSFLETYGMRCVGEIDITRPRWNERPAMLVPMILSNVECFEPGAGRRRFEQGQKEAREKEDELLARLRALPEGATKAQETKAHIDRLRTFIGYREYPKYHMVSRYFLYRMALLKEAERLVARGVLHVKEDLFYLRFEELYGIVHSGRADRALIQSRRAAFRSSEALTPPRVLTSDGEVLAGSYRDRDAPAGALVGLPVSAGIVEGRARVVLDVAEAELVKGDILVTAYTDPSWTPLFVAITGLVTEVGGLMTHGSVIARECGLAAVVGVEGATRRIHDGQRIRVHGTEGYVEILD